MKSNQEIYASERDANRLHAGIYKKDFSEWYTIDGNHYAPLGGVCGIEKKRNKILFHNFIDGNIYHVKFVTFATLNGEEYFIRLLFYGGGELFIPIR